MKIINILSLLMMFPGLADAGLVPLADAELGENYGQAIFEVQDQKVAQPSGPELDMLKLTIGARVEINANIEEVALGRYWRPAGTNCTGGSGGDKVCYNNILPAGYDDQIKWACTSQPCGSVGLDPANYRSSLITHDTGGEKDFSDKSAFPGGFEPDGGVDLKLRDLTLGQVRDDNNDGIYELTPVVLENPYLEFAFDKSSGSRRLVGFRMGFEDSFGYQGNSIDVISGFIRPAITADARLGDFDLGTINLETQLGGVRTIGWIDPRTTRVNSVDRLASILVSDPNSLLALAGTAQLFPVQSIYLNHSAAFFFSVGTRAIQWSSLTAAGGKEFSPSVTQPGFWANLGGDGALVAETQRGDHPLNYMPGHPKYDVFKDNTNYDNAQASWSQTYQ